MSIPVVRLSPASWRIMGALLAFALPMLLGGGTIYQMQKESLVSQSRFDAGHALELIDNMLQGAERANHTASFLVGQPCVEAIFTMRRSAALAPFIRTINLVQQQTVYCNSLFGAVSWPDNSEADEGYRLQLNAGSVVRANHPVMALRQPTQKGVVYSTIDAESLQFLLGLSSQNTAMIMQVGNQWLDEQGVLYQRQPDLPKVALHQVSSARYPLVIYAGHDAPSLWYFLWRDRQLALLMLSFTSVVLALLAFWSLGRPRSPVQELGRALRAREFKPYLQPLVASDSGRIIGGEVLMRWQHPASGLIRPDLFIPQAEACGLIVPMTTLLMDRVANALSPYQQWLPDGFHVGINISAAHCRDLSLLQDCETFLARFAPGKVVLVLELTERQPLEATALTLSLFKRLDQMGIKLAIDDFGTGHASLAYLHQFNVDYLKIDKSFIDRIGSESLSQQLVENVIDLGNRLEMKLVAEGVETEAQACYLQGKGVEFLQGYLYGRPLPIELFCAELPLLTKAAESPAAS